MASANATGLLLGTKIHGVSLTATMEFVKLTNHMINAKEKRMVINLAMERGVGIMGEVLNVQQIQVLVLLTEFFLALLYIKFFMNSKIKQYLPIYYIYRQTNFNNN